MSALTPKASWMTTIAGSGVTFGRATYAAKAPSEALIWIRSCMPFSCEPEGDVADVLFRRTKRLRKPAHPVDGRLGHERGTAGRWVPVVVGEVVEGRLLDATATM